MEALKTSQENTVLQVVAWETTPKGEDNIKHLDITDSRVDMISVPIVDNNLDCSQEGHPKEIDMLRSKLDFKGSIRLSNSGQSWTLFKDVLDVKSDMIRVDLGVSAS